MEPEYRCHWTHAHGPHEWTPLVSDPEAERVLHLFMDAPVRCPGLTSEEPRTVHIGPDWADLGFTTIEPAEGEPTTFGSLHDTPPVMDIEVSEVSADFLRLAFGRDVGRPRYYFEAIVPMCPIEAPYKHRGLTGKRYRIARRRYAREMQAWRRTGSPTVPRVISMPHVHVTADPESFGGQRLSIAPIIDEARGFGL